MSTDSDSEQSPKREWIAEVATVVKSSHTMHSRDLPSIDKIMVPKEGRLTGRMSGQIPEYWIVSEGVINNAKLPKHIRFIHKRQWRLLPLLAASELVKPYGEGILDFLPPQPERSISDSEVEQTPKPVSIPKGLVALEVNAEGLPAPSSSPAAATGKAPPVGLFAFLRHRLLGW